MSRAMFILGAAGFIGRRVVETARENGWDVTALVRRPEAAAELGRHGVRTIIGDATDARAWGRALAGADVVVDLVQPRLPSRITARAIRDAAAERLSVTTAILGALHALPAGERPLLVAASGVDDLAPDEHGVIRDGAPRHTHATGFAAIGLPVRASIERAGVDAVHLYFATVYGPGKQFAATVFPRLAAGRFPIIGGGANRMALIHVDDVARAVVHLAGTARTQLVGGTLLVTDGTLTTQRAFFEHAAHLMGAPRPRAIPRWTARLAAGRILADVMCRDVVTVPSTLAESGFRYRYPSYRDGLPATLADLRLLAPVTMTSPALETV